MARCEPIVDAAFVQMVTGADISDLKRVDELISVTSDLVAEELVGPTACINPELAQMRLKVIVAEFVAYNLTIRPNDQVVKAETIGDYRVEYQNSNGSGMDLGRLRMMLKPLRNRAYTVHTIDELQTDGRSVVWGARA
jgi:hypothetical protein